MTNYLHQDLTKEIISVFYDVYNELGYGFLEKVYQNAFYIELLSRGFKVESNKNRLVDFASNLQSAVKALKSLDKKYLYYTYLLNSTINKLPDAIISNYYNYLKRGHLS